LAQDLAGTLRRVCEIGYGAVETYPFSPEISIRAVAEWLKELELQVVAMHCEVPAETSLPGILEATAAFNCKRVIWHGWPKPPEFDSLHGVRALANRYNEAHGLARKNGLELGLHNHWWEFEPLQGVYPYQLFHELLHPEIFFEIDTYWAQTAGRNPASVVRELPGRVKLLHVKDGPAIHGAPMTALGQGALDFPSILRGLATTVDLVVELDECATDIFAAINQSLKYLRGLTKDRD
jgi:sugar phosphate isomerase/epimerase